MTAETIKRPACIAAVDLVSYVWIVYRHRIAVSSQRLDHEFNEFAARLGFRDLRYIPMSALCGENVTRRSAKMPWYTGVPLLEHLESVEVVSDRNLEEYTVWGVALHLHRYKEIFLARLEGRDPQFPAGDEDFPAVPAEGLTEGRWLAVLTTMDATHDALSARARTLDEPFLDTSFDGGDMTWAEGLISVFTHDFYHVAQIRSMGR